MRGPFSRVHERRYGELRQAVQGLPHSARREMLAGLRPGRIIAGAYSAGGGLCPAMAAYRRGARTDYTDFARAWDRYTRVRYVRRASPDELKTLAELLELSLVVETAHTNGNGNGRMPALNGNGNGNGNGHNGNGHNGNGHHPNGNGNGNGKPAEHELTPAG